MITTMVILGIAALLLSYLAGARADLKAILAQKNEDMVRILARDIKVTEIPLDMIEIEKLHLSVGNSYKLIAGLPTTTVIEQEAVNRLTNATDNAMEVVEMLRTFESNENYLLPKEVLSAIVKTIDGMLETCHEKYEDALELAKAEINVIILGDKKDESNTDKG
jgi:hypothetical protein